MSSFKEYLEDYELRENESHRKYYKKLKKGKKSACKIFPSRKRFPKLKTPIANSTALIGQQSVWSVVPFYGSTIINLSAVKDRQVFDDYCINGLKIGLDSRNFDEMIDLVKNTGRIQFILSDPAPSYQNLDFLESLFYELEPPQIPNTVSALMGDEFKVSCKKFSTLMSLGFENELFLASESLGMSNDNDFMVSERIKYLTSYASLKYLGYNDIIEKIDLLMDRDPLQARTWINLFGSLLGIPVFDPLKATHIFTQNSLQEAYHFSSNKIKMEAIPCEIGKFILEQRVRYPETKEGCFDIIQHYDDNELYKVLEALDTSVKHNDIDLIEEKSEDTNQILTNIWQETSGIKSNVGIARMEIGLLGGLAASFSGEGLLAGLGFAVADKLIGFGEESISEKFVKFFSPNHLVTIYDFKKKYKLL